VGDGDAATELDGDEVGRRRLQYRLLRPARRAIERDEQAIARWVTEGWP
jgi:Winged helix-turn helix